MKRGSLLVFLFLGMLLTTSCKKKTEENNGNNNPPQIADIHGDWVGKWIADVGEEGIIHLKIDQIEDTVDVSIVFDSMYTDTFVLSGILDIDHISGYAYSKNNDTFKCVFSLTYSNDTLRGTYNFLGISKGSWWAVRGTHLVEIGWNYFGSLSGYPFDVFYSNDGTLYLVSTNGLYASEDYGISFELLNDTSGFYSMCGVNGIIYATSFGKVLKSEDGGNTWHDITPSDSLFQGGSGTLIRFRTSSEGFIITGDDIYYTSDGGNNWTLHENALPGLANSVFITSSSVYAVGYIPGQTYGGFAAVSGDNGATWTQFDISNFHVDELNSIYVDGNKILLGGKKVPDSTDDHDLRILLYSEDGGSTFEKENFPGEPQHDEWIGSVMLSGNTLFAGNVYPSGNLIVYSFDSNGIKADTVSGFSGYTSKSMLNYGNGNLGLITSNGSNTVIFYYRSE